MPSIKRYLELNTNSHQLSKYLVHILTSMNAVMKTVTNNFINAVHGSYCVLNPRNAKKYISITIKSSNNRSCVDISVDYTSYMVLTVIFTIIFLTAGSILLYQTLLSLSYLSDLEHNPLIVFVKKMPGLLYLLLHSFNNLGSVKNALLSIELISVVFLIAGFIGIMYAIVAPSYISNFADELVSRITSFAEKHASAEKETSMYSSQSKEDSHQGKVKQ